MSNITKLVLNSGSFQIDASEPNDIRFISTNNKKFNFGNSLKAADFVIENNGTQTSIGETSIHRFVNVYMLNNIITTSLSVPNVYYDLKGNFISDLSNGFDFSVVNDEFELTFSGPYPCICTYNVCGAYGVNFSNRSFMIAFKINNIVEPTTVFHFEGFQNQINTISLCGMFTVNPNDSIKLSIQGMNSNNSITIQDFNLNIKCVNHM
jgi:hypothetical protein